MEPKKLDMKRKFSFTAKQTMIILFSLLWICICLISFYCPASFAAGISTFAGGEIDGRGQGFSYIGIDLTQSINKTVSVYGRIVPNFLTYKYYSGDTLIKASSPGLSPVAGIKLFWDQTILGVFGGVELRNTTLSPDDKSASVRGSTTDGLIQGEFDTTFPSKTNLNITASYSGTSNFSYERGRIKQQITNLDFKEPYTLNIGVEGFYGRNSDFYQEGAGLILELFHISERISVALRGGFKHDSTFGNGVYGGLEFYKGF